MAALIVEIVAYLLLAPIRLIGLIGGRRTKNWSTRVEDWLLHHAWGIGASGDQYALEAFATLKYKDEANRNLAFNTRDLEPGRRYVEGGNARMSRSEQVREAMVEAQRRQNQQAERARKRRQRD